MGRIVLIPKNMIKVASMTRHLAESMTRTAQWLRSDRPPEMGAANMRRYESDTNDLATRLHQLSRLHAEAAADLRRRAELASRFYEGLRRQNLPMPDSARWKPTKPKVPFFRGTIRPGENSSLVKQLQQRLRASGLNVGTIDGDFGPKTKAAVIAFQKRMGLTPDGIVGPATAMALGLRAEPGLATGGSHRAKLLRALEHAEEIGLRIGSLNDGGHSTGSYHYRDASIARGTGIRQVEGRSLGRAADIVKLYGGPYLPEQPLLTRFFKDVESTRPTELFYDHISYYVKYGVRVRGQIGGHLDHLHVAY